MRLELFGTPIFITNIDLDKIKIESEDFKREWHSNTRDINFGANKYFLY